MPAIASHDSSDWPSALLTSFRQPLKKMGIQLPEYNGDDAWELPIPGTYVIDQDGTIRLAYVDANYTTRLEPGDILESLQGLN